MNHNGAFSAWGGLPSPSFERQNGALVVLYECLCMAECLLTGPLGAPYVFQSLHSMFKVSFETLLEMWNMNFHWPSLVSFFVHQFTGLKSSLESCPGSLRHLVVKAQWRHRCGSPGSGSWPVALGHLWSSGRKGGQEGLPSQSAATCSHLLPASARRKTNTLIS